MLTSWSGRHIRLIAFDIRVVVVFAKLMWHSENEKEFLVKVPLSLPAKLEELTACFIKALNITRQSSTENAAFYTNHFGIICLLGAQIT